MIDKETEPTTTEDAAKPDDKTVTVAEASPAPKRPPMIVTCKC